MSNWSIQARSGRHESRLVWAVVGVAALFSLTMASTCAALSATEITGTWTGTWTSRVYANTGGDVTLILSGAESAQSLGGLVYLSGTITMTGPGKEGIAQVPILEGVVYGATEFLSLQGLPPADIPPCVVRFDVRGDLSPTRLVGTYGVTRGCHPNMMYAIDTGVFEARKTGALSLDQQAQLDMISRAERDARFGAADIGTFGSNPDWDPNWELRWMNFAFSAGRAVTIYHATYKFDSAYRYTIFLDPDTGQWANWEPAD
jgi:hypothetical protein